MNSIVLNFKNPKDKDKIQQIIEILGMDVEISEQEIQLTDQYYRDLDEDLKQYKSGKLKAKSWEEVENNARKKIGL